MVAVAVVMLFSFLIQTQESIFPDDIFQIRQCYYRRSGRQWNWIVNKDSSTFHISISVSSPFILIILKKFVEKICK